MFLLSHVHYPQFNVRIDEVRTMANKYTGEPEYLVVVTIQLSRRHDDEVQLVLWASSKAAHVIKPEQDFIAREVVLEGFGPRKSEGWKPGPVGLTAIWFDDPDNERCGAQLGQVRHAVVGSVEETLIHLLASE